MADSLIGCIHGTTVRRDRAKSHQWMHSGPQCLIDFFSTPSAIFSK
jgi:hypothetical protein